MSPEPNVVWKPNPGPQTEFLACIADEVLYGGAAGGGKSDALLIAPLRWAHLPAANAILFRPTFPEIDEVLVPRSRRYFNAVAPDADYNQQKHTWTFPSGARLRFAYMQTDADAEDHQGAEYSYVGFDELTKFTEYQFLYLRGRLRGTTGVPKRLRAASNPGGPGHAWVQKRWGPWLGGIDWKGPRAEPGEKLCFIDAVTCHCFEHEVKDDHEQWVEKDFKPRCEHEFVQTRTFIPAKMGDNPHLDEGYRAQLAGLDKVTREQLINGNWQIRPAAGNYFKREWWQFCDSTDVSNVARRLRFWDLASTAPNETNQDPDWTIGVRWAYTKDGRGFIEDVVRVRKSPGGVRDTVNATAELDGRDVEVWIFQDPAQAGKDQVESYATMLKGFRFSGRRPTTDKVTAAGPLSSSVEHKQVWLVRAPWNETFTGILEAFPTKGVHDDDVDAASGGWACLTGHETSREHSAKLLAMKFR